jgi:hypothetical protein
MPGRFPALAHREFRRHFTGQAIALVGGFAHNVAMAWLAYRLTGSVAVLDVVGFAQAAPTLLVSPVAGLLADRYPRRRMLIGLLGAVALLGLVLAALTATGHVTPTVLVAVALLRGLAIAFEIPIRNAFLADIVPDRTALPNAVALHSSALNSARFIGPAIGGLLIGAVGEAACFLLHPLTLTATLEQLMRIRTNESAVRRAKPDAGRGRRAARVPPRVRGHVPVERGARRDARRDDAGRTHRRLGDRLGVVDMVAARDAHRPSFGAVAAGQAPLVVGAVTPVAQPGLRSQVLGLARPAGSLEKRGSGRQQPADLGDRRRREAGRRRRVRPAQRHVDPLAADVHHTIGELQFDADGGKRQQESGEPHGEHELPPRDRCGHPDSPGQLGAQVAHALLCSGHLGQRAPCAVEVGLTGWRQRHATCAATEQRGADQRLQLRDPLADDPLADCELRRRHADAQRFGDLHECAEHVGRDDHRSRSTDNPFAFERLSRERSSR